MGVPIPIFIITKDRLEVLKKVIASFRAQIASPFQLIIHDNNSTYPPLLNYFEELKKEGVKVYYNKITGRNITDELHSVRTSIHDYFFSLKRQSSFYVITDPDIVLDHVAPDILDFYMHVLDKYNDIQVVGPQLRIDDIPAYYSLRKRVFQKHANFWNGRYPSIVVLFKGKKIKCVRCSIDTTFGMYRNGYIFRRLSNGLRTYSPYSAKHLDWYIDPKRISPDVRHYMKTEEALKIGHWSTRRGLLKGKVL